MKQAAILIDCWGNSKYLARQEELPKSTHDLISNIKKFLKDNKELDTVILSTYDAPTEINTNSIWYRNSKSFLQKNRTVKNELYLQEFQKTGQYRVTYEDIIGWHFTNKYQYAAHFPFELQHHYDKVYLCGAAFDICIQQRPLGLNFFKGVQYSTVHIKKDCVLTSENTYPELENLPEWEHTGHDFFKYIG